MDEEEVILDRPLLCLSKIFVRTLSSLMGVGIFFFFFLIIRRSHFKICNLGCEWVLVLFTFTKILHETPSYHLYIFNFFPFGLTVSHILPISQYLHCLP